MDKINSAKAKVESAKWKVESAKGKVQRKKYASALKNITFLNGLIPISSSKKAISVLSYFAKSTKNRKAKQRFFLSAKLCDSLRNSALQLIHKEPYSYGLDYIKSPVSFL